MDTIGRVIVWTLAFVISQGCSTGPGTAVRGPYGTWDEVVTRWIGAQKQDLYYELGPPNLHPKQTADGKTEMVWDMTIDRMPGQADEYNLLPLYNASVNCQLVFFADTKDIIRAGRRIGCD
jgi:hypothetical protein